MSEIVSVLGIAGSLRSGSYNRILLRTAVDRAASNVRIETAEIKDIPLYDADLQADGDPDVVVELKQRVRQADALLICTPEYNNSVPGVLKNAIDWLSRPPAESPLEGKPVGIMGATDGPWGTVRSQQHLRLVLASTGSIVMVRPTVFLARAAEFVDKQSRLADPVTIRRIENFTRALGEWALLFKQARQRRQAEETAAVRS